MKLCIYYFFIISTVCTDLQETLKFVIAGSEQHKTSEHQQDAWGFKNLVLFDK